MRLGRSVAVKAFRQHTELTGNEARQQREIQVLARLQHTRPPHLPSTLPPGWSELLTTSSCGRPVGGWVTGHV